MPLVTHNGFKNGKRVARSEFSTLAFNVIFKRNAVQKFHNDIRRRVRREEVKNFNDTTVVGNLFKVLSLVDKAFKPTVGGRLALA